MIKSTKGAVPTAAAMSQSVLVQPFQSFQPQDILDSSQITAGFTRDQNLQLFEHTKRIAELNEETARMNNERVRMENEKVKIELEQARLKIGKIRNGVGKAAGNFKEDKEDDEGGISLEIKPITTRFPRLQQEQIVNILRNKFKPINLCRLYRGMSFFHEEEEGVYVVNGVLTMKKVGGTYKDYGTSFYDAWSEAFFFYSTIMVFLFGKTSPDLVLALGEFRTKIHELSRVYEWQGAVLPLAIDAHTEILAAQPTEATSWIIRDKLQELYCTPLTVLNVKRSVGGDMGGRSTSRKRSRSPRQTPAQNKKQAGSRLREFH